MLTITRSETQRAAEHGMLSKPLIQEANKNYYPIVTIDGNEVAIRTTKKHSKDHKERLIFFTHFMTAFEYLLSLGFDKEDINIKRRSFIPGSASDENHVNNNSIPAMRREDAVENARNGKLSNPTIVSDNGNFYVEFLNLDDDRNYRLRANAVNKYLVYSSRKRAAIMLINSLGFSEAQIAEVNV